MNKYVWIIVIGLIIYLVIFFGRKILINGLTGKMYAYMSINDKKNFFKTCNSFLTKLLIPPYNRLFMKLNFSLHYDDMAEIIKIEEEFSKVRSNPDQKIAFYNLLFSVYLDKKNHQKTKEYYDKLVEIFDQNPDKYEKQRENTELMMDVYDRHDFKRVNQLKEIADKSEGDTKAAYLFQQAILYYYHEEREKAMELLKKAITVAKTNELKVKLQQIYSSNGVGL